MKLLILLLLVPFVSSTQTVTSIANKTKNYRQYKGFLNFYWDESEGKIWLEINKLDSEMLYQVSLPAGLGSNDVGLDRGILGKTSIVKFSRVGNKLLLIEPNMRFRAITGKAAEKRTVEQSFAQSILYGFTIEAESNGSTLVDATNFLLRDAMMVSTTLKNAEQGNYDLDKTRSAIYLPRTKNFPFNSEFESTVTFVNTDGKRGNFVSSVTPSSEAVTLRMHHSFMQLPDNNYKPRRYDARSPFATISYADYSTPVSEPIQKFYIVRHRLEKKEPALSMSDPVKPIVYYLDDGTPEPIRSALLEGASWWNQAFEAAGYRNAFQVKILPDSSDPMDLRYNMINWVHRSTRGWSFGSSVVDPRTGEIIKGNVTLGSLRVRQDYLIAQGLLSPFENGMPSDNKMLKMSVQRLKQLAAHEVGHTLGLMHNYISSSQDRASVMDYPPPVVKVNDKNEIDLGDAYTNEIGIWDKVSIAYGYQQFMEGTNEDAELNKILVEASSKGLTFISDRDARPAGGLHPNAHLWDVGRDPVEGLKQVMKVRATALSRFGENSIKAGTPMAMIEDVLVPVYLFHRYQLEAVSKVVGGLYYSYAIRGDGQLITLSVSKEQQLKALMALIDCMDPAILALPERIISLIPPRPPEYDYNRELFNRRTGIAFDPLAAAETAADLPLSFLFNVERLNRMVQFEEERKGLGINQMVNILVNKFWEAPQMKGLHQLIVYQNQQLLLTYLLAASINDKASFATKAALQNGIDLVKHLATEHLNSADNTKKGYLLLTLERIKSPEKAKPTLHLTSPPGSPIGCETE